MRMNHKTTKKKIKVDKMTELLSRTNFQVRNKIWIAKFNLLKDKFRSKREVDKYLIDDFENSFKRHVTKVFENNLRKEFRNDEEYKKLKYKILKVIKYKRKDPIRKAQVNHLIKEYRGNRLKYKRNKKIDFQKHTEIAFHEAVILDMHEPFARRNLIVKSDFYSIIDNNRIPIWFTEDQIEQMNTLLSNCFYISTKNNKSILDPQARDPDIDTIDRPCDLKWNLMEEMIGCLYTFWPENYKDESNRLFGSLVEQLDFENPNKILSENDFDMIRKNIKELIMVCFNHLIYWRDIDEKYCYKDYKIDWAYENRAKVWKNIIEKM